MRVKLPTAPARLEQLTASAAQNASCAAQRTSCTRRQSPPASSAHLGPPARRRNLHSRTPPPARLPADRGFLPGRLPDACPSANPDRRAGQASETLNQNGREPSAGNTTFGDIRGADVGSVTLAETGGQAASPPRQQKLSAAGCNLGSSLCRLEGATHRDWHAPSEDRRKDDHLVPKLTSLQLQLDRAINRSNSEAKLTSSSRKDSLVSLPASSKLLPM